MIQLSRTFLIFFWLLVSNIALADEPRRVTEYSAVNLFIESQRTEQNGQGKILATASHDYDGDSFPDKLVIYAYAHGPNPGDKTHETFAVAFLTEDFNTTDVLVIPETEMVPFTLREYSSGGKDLIIKGAKRLPGDAMCCPSAITSITLTVADGEVAVLKGEYYRRIDRD